MFLICLHRLTSSPKPLPHDCAWVVSHPFALVSNQIIALKLLNATALSGIQFSSCLPNSLILKRVGELLQCRVLLPQLRVDISFHTGSQDKNPRRPQMGLLTISVGKRGYRF